MKIIFINKAIRFVKRYNPAFLEAATPIGLERYEAHILASDCYMREKEDKTDEYISLVWPFLFRDYRADLDRQEELLRAAFHVGRAREYILKGNIVSKIENYEKKLLAICQRMDKCIELLALELEKCETQKS